MDYTEFIFHNVNEEMREVIIAVLSEQEYEGFEEDQHDLKCYIPSDKFDREAVINLAEKFSLQTSTTLIPNKNWNSDWESNFAPVMIDDFCMIRAPFHPAVASATFDLVITPKMSFGTGHHATTYMMISQMKHIDLTNKSVLDFGTGTGVLAILAVFMGAKEVLAVDYDQWSIENAKENFEYNHTSRINLIKADNAAGLGKFDVILANITRNVITDNFEHFISQLNNHGILLLSGLLDEDEPHIVNLATPYPLALISRIKRDKWICMEFAKA